MLLRKDGGFILKRDQGGYYTLELARTPVDLVEKQVRLVGVLIGENHVEAAGVQPV